MDGCETTRSLTGETSSASLNALHLHYLILATGQRITATHPSRLQADPVVLSESLMSISAIERSRDLFHREARGTACVFKLFMTLTTIHGEPASDPSKDDSCNSNEPPSPLEPKVDVLSQTSQQVGK